MALTGYRYKFSTVSYNGKYYDGFLRNLFKEIDSPVYGE